MFDLKAFWCPTSCFFALINPVGKKPSRETCRRSDKRVTVQEAIAQKSLTNRLLIQQFAGCVSAERLLATLVITLVACTCPGVGHRTFKFLMTRYRAMVAI